LTTAPRIKPTSIFLRSARRPNPGRRSTYRRGIIVRTTGTGSDLESEIGVEQGGDLGRIPAAADPFQKLLCNSYVLLLTHLLSP
jgi:hypothetical protein